MRKQELIHVHGLLDEIRHYLAEQEGIDLPEDAFDAYDDHGVGPRAIAERKSTHKEAVGHLVAGFDTALTTPQGATEAPSPSSGSSDASTA